MAVVTLKKIEGSDALEIFTINGVDAYPSDFGFYDPDNLIFTPLPLDENLCEALSISVESGERVQDILSTFIGLYPWGAEITEEV